MLVNKKINKKVKDFTNIFGNIFVKRWLLFLLKLQIIVEQFQQVKNQKNHIRILQFRVMLFVVDFFRYMLRPTYAQYPVDGL